MIKKKTFPSGLRVVMEKIPSVRSVALGIWIGTGSKYETEKNNGISHFLEHMLFKGTEKRNAREIAETFDSIGGQLNAFTSKENTCYYAKVLDQHVPIAFEVLSDMFFHSTFAPSEITKEKQVILEELKMYLDTPDDMIHDLVAKATFRDHSLGYSILGQEKVLHKLTAADFREYMSNYYVPENTVIAVAGNIEEEEIIQLTERFFNQYQSKNKLSDTTPPEITYDHLMKVKDTEQAHLCLGLKSLSIMEPKIYPLILLNNILGGSMSSRLFQTIREEHGLAYSVYSYHSSYKEIGSLHIYAGTAPRHLEKVYELIISTLQNLAKEGITAKELHNGKEQMKGSLMLSLESTNSRMSRIGKNELLGRGHLTLDEMVARIDKVQLEDVHQLARELFRQQHSFSLISPLQEIPDNINVDRLL